MKILSAVLLVIAFVFSSCTVADNLIENVLYPYKKPQSFEYYDKDFKLDKNTQLKTENFYYTKGEGISGHYYEYLKFYPDGTVYYLGGTAIEPDNGFKNGYIDTKRKKNGVPKYRKASWGRYNFYSDTIKLNIVDYTAFSTDYRKYLGKISNDTIYFEVYKKEYTSGKYNYSHSGYFVYFLEE
ncbi:MAG: hypothetical protein JXL97_13035 [Bacteroidales bacterium]|nr:hypothetical protein [Bacteroidales bacterium]